MTSVMCLIFHQIFNVRMPNLTSSLIGRSVEIGSQDGDLPKDLSYGVAICLPAQLTHSFYIEVLAMFDCGFEIIHNKHSNI